MPRNAAFAALESTLFDDTLIRVYLVVTEVFLAWRISSPASVEMVSH